MFFSPFIRVVHWFSLATRERKHKYARIYGVRDVQTVFKALFIFMKLNVIKSERDKAKAQLRKCHEKEQKKKETKVTKKADLSWLMTLVGSSSMTRWKKEAC